MKVFKKLWSYMSFFKLAHFMHSCFWSVKVLPKALMWGTVGKLEQNLWSCNLCIES